MAQTTVLLVEDDDLIQTLLRLYEEYFQDNQLQRPDFLQKPFSPKENDFLCYVLCPGRRSRNRSEFRKGNDHGGAVPNY